MKLSHNINIIYCYRDISINKVVYVGQTSNLRDRHRRHIRYDPFDPAIREYHYPLSRGIRKYGASRYQLEILEENVPTDQMDEQEIYWIDYYNTYYDGFNQTKGGQNSIPLKYSDVDILKVIDLLQNTTFSFPEIEKITGISITHIYNINIGARRKQNNLNYPIRSNKEKGCKGIVFSPQENLEIHKLLSTTKRTVKDIAKEYGVTNSVITDINYGRIKVYRLSEYNYPIRKRIHLTEEQHINLKKDLQENKLSDQELSKKYSCSISLVQSVNYGRTKKDSSLFYPLRKCYKVE